MTCAGMRETLGLVLSIGYERRFQNKWYTGKLNSPAQIEFRYAYTCPTSSSALRQFVTSDRTFVEIPRPGVLKDVRKDDGILLRNIVYEARNKGGLERLANVESENFNYFHLNALLFVEKVNARSTDRNWISSIKTSWLVLSLEIEWLESQPGPDDSFHIDEKVNVNPPPIVSRIPLSIEKRIFSSRRKQNDRNSFLVSFLSRSAHRCNSLLWKISGVTRSYIKPIRKHGQCALASQILQFK